MLEFIAIVAGVIAVVTAAVAAWMWNDRRHLADRVDRLAADVKDREAAIEGYLTEIERRGRAVADRDLTIKELQTKLDGLDDKFKALAGDVLEKAGKQFLQLANENFQGKQKDAEAELEKRKQAIEALLKPIRETLGKHQEAVGKLESDRKEAYGALRQQLLSMVQDQKSLRDETANLVKALRRPEVRGAWGHLQLKRVAELAGMMPHVVYDCEVTSDDGSLRADMVVHLPGAREIVIDAKTPIDAYISAMEAGDDAEREQQMQRHIGHIESKVRDLSSKRYQDHFQSADFVVMFIPGEAFLQPAVVRKPTLMEEAMEKGVIIATPTMLVALLKVVALGWREEKIAESAERIRQLGQELHERIATATNHVDKLGRTLESAVKTYNDFVGSFESRVVVSARKFKELGADSAKELPAEGEIKQVEVAARDVKSPAE